MMKKILFAVLSLGIFASCSTVTEDIVNIAVESEMQNGWETASKNSMNSKPDSKKTAAEREKLKKEGKCPVCRGMGKSVDGKYDCPTCKGTGKIQ